MSRSVRTVVTAFVAVLSLAFCYATIAFAEGTPAGSSPWAGAFAAARAEATSDFERNVLADDAIAQGEYDEAAARFVACLRDEPNGFSVTAEPDPLIPGAVVYRGDIAPDLPPDIRERVIASCQEGTTALIEPLFIAIAVNPDHADFDGLVLACLEDRGVEVSDLTALREEAGPATARINPTATPSGPRGATDELVVACLVNPLNAEPGATPAG